MADTKISALTAIVDPSGIEELPVNDAGTSKKETAGLLSGPSIELTAAYVLTSQTAAQKAFNAPAGGALTLKANTTYFFEVMISLTAMSASSGSFGFALGGTAVLTRQAWMAFAQKAGALAVVETDQITFNTAANVALVTASTSTTGEMWIRGIIRVGTGGTVIPQVSLGVAAAAIVGIDSYAIFKPIGADTVQSVGNWS